MRNYKPTVTAVMTLQTALMKGRCPWKTPSKLAYVVAMTVRKFHQKIKQKQKTTHCPSFKATSTVYRCILSIFLCYKWATLKAHRPKRYSLNTHAIPMYLGGFSDQICLNQEVALSYTKSFKLLWTSTCFSFYLCTDTITIKNITIHLDDYMF